MLREEGAGRRRRRPLVLRLDHAQLRRCPERKAALICLSHFRKHQRFLLALGVDLEVRARSVNMRRQKGGFRDGLTEE